MTLSNLPLNLFFTISFIGSSYLFTYFFNQLNIIKKIKKDYEKNLVKDIKIFLKRKKKKRDNMVVNVTKIFKKMKKINGLSIKKKIIE